MIITTLVLLKLTEVGLEEGEGWVGLRGWGVGRDSGGGGGWDGGASITTI